MFDTDDKPGGERRDWRLIRRTPSPLSAARGRTNGRCPAFIGLGTIGSHTLPPVATGFPGGGARHPVASTDPISRRCPSVSARYRRHCAAFPREARHGPSQLRRHRRRS